MREKQSLYFLWTLHVHNVQENIFDSYIFLWKKCKLKILCPFFMESLGQTKHLIVHLLVIFTKFSCLNYD